MHAIKPIKRSDCEALVSMKGAKLLGVKYHYFPPFDGTGYVGVTGVDDSLPAVEFDFGHLGKKTITWAMAGTLEGLSVFSGAYSGIASEVLDASQREAWCQHIGQSIISVAASWQISNEGCPESLWAIRLGFAKGSVVIALGTTRSDIEYIPDELVVIFEPSLARSYRPRGAAQSSWGTDV
jgi:hypothetical protein